MQQKKCRVSSLSLCPRTQIKITTHLLILENFHVISVNYNFFQVNTGIRLGHGLVGPVHNFTYDVHNRVFNHKLTLKKINDSIIS